MPVVLSRQLRSVRASKPVHRHRRRRLGRAAVAQVLPTFRRHHHRPAVRDQGTHGEGRVKTCQSGCSERISRHPFSVEGEPGFEPLTAQMGLCQL